MRWVVAAVAALAGACELDRTAVDRAALLDPAECAVCHPRHYEEWSGSMHAYASDDPMFIAMNQKLQDDTGGAAAGFCIGCHAPMAVREGATVDGTDLEDVPRALRGVTCYFCHQVDRVDGDHNGQLHLADDDVFRGGIGDPVDALAHGSAGSALHDGALRSSSDLCGSCHDVVTPSGLHLERTYAEWQASLFGQDWPGAVSCGGCHMPGRDGRAAEIAGAPVRRVHDHAMPGIDVALTPWPQMDAQRAGIARDLDGSLAAKLCVTPAAGGLSVELTLDNVLAGHAWPSGVTHARRAWAEIVAYAGDEVVFATGVVADGEPVALSGDANLWAMWSRLLDADGNEVHLPWLADSSDSRLLQPAVTNDPSDPAYYHAQARAFELTDPRVDRVTARVRMRPVGLEIVDALIDLDLLDPAVRDRVPTFTLAATELEWTSDTGFGCTP